MCQLLFSSYKNKREEEFCHRCSVFSSSVPPAGDDVSVLFAFLFVLFFNLLFVDQPSG